MTSSTLEIQNRAGGDFTGFAYYGKNYKGKRQDEVYDTLTEANEAFREWAKEEKLDVLPLENYLNPIQ